LYDQLWKDYFKSTNIIEKHYTSFATHPEAILTISSRSLI